MRPTFQDAARRVAENAAAEARNRDEHYRAAIARRPRLSADTAVDYIDWLTSSLDALPPETVAHHFTAAELAVRVHMGNAQAKATQHTLVQDGTIAPPPNAS